MRRATGFAPNHRRPDSSNAPPIPLHLLPSDDGLVHVRTVGFIPLDQTFLRHDLHQLNVVVYCDGFSAKDSRGPAARSLRRGPKDVENVVFGTVGFGSFVEFVMTCEV